MRLNKKMSDIKKAFDAYKKASAAEKEAGKSGGKIEKYVFADFESEKKPAGRKDSNYFIKEIEKPERPEKPEKPEKPGQADRRAAAEAVAVPVQDKPARSFEKIAKVLLLLGRDEAASVLKHFKPDEIEKIASAMIRVKHIDTKEAVRLLSEINKKTSLNDTFSGGVETARKMLHAAFGQEKGEKFLAKALPETKEKPFEFLQDIEPLQIKLALKDEPLTMISLVMNYLEPDKSASLLKEYTKSEQKEIILRMASGGKIQREVFEKMEQVIKDKVRLQGKIITQRIDGRSKLANILKFMDVKDEQEIINELSEFDPDLSQEITDQVYTIDIVMNIPDIYMQKVLGDFSDREIAVVLKGRSADIKNKILSSLSQTRKEIVRQESEYLGIMRKSEVNIATREFIDYLKQAEKDGVIVINRAGDLIL